MRRLIVEFEEIDEKEMNTIKQKIKSYVIDLVFCALNSGSYKISIPKGVREWVYWKDE